MGFSLTRQTFAQEGALKKPLVAASIACLLLGVLPYAQGLFVLQTVELEASEVGPWLALMLLGVLYASLASALLAVVDLTGWLKKALALLLRGQNRTAAHSPKAQLQEVR